MAASDEKVGFGCSDETNYAYFKYTGEKGKYQLTCGKSCPKDYPFKVKNPYWPRKEEGSETRPARRLQTVCIKCDSDKDYIEYDQDGYVKNDVNANPLDRSMFTTPRCICSNPNHDFQFQTQGKYTYCDEINTSGGQTRHFYHSPNIIDRVRNSARTCLYKGAQKVNEPGLHVLSSYYNDDSKMYEIICDERDSCTEKNGGKMHKFVDEDNIEMCIPSGMQAPENFQYYFDNRDKYSFRR
jgi:hypothetical protein